MSFSLKDDEIRTQIQVESFGSERVELFFYWIPFIFLTKFTKFPRTSHKGVKFCISVAFIQIAQFPSVPSFSSFAQWLGFACKTEFWLSDSAVVCCFWSELIFPGHWILNAIWIVHSFWWHLNTIWFRSLLCRRWWQSNRSSTSEVISNHREHFLATVSARIIQSKIYFWNRASHSSAASLLYNKTPCHLFTFNKLYC